MPYLIPQDSMIFDKNGDGRFKNEKRKACRIGIDFINEHDHNMRHL